MKRVLSYLIFTLVITGCSHDIEHHFNQEEVEFLKLVERLKHTYGNRDFTRGSVDILNCEDYEKELPSDICDNELSTLLKSLGLKRIRMMDDYCDTDNVPTYQITFMYSTGALMPTQYLVYDGCDEMIDEGSHFVEIKKLKANWYLKIDSNFP